MTNHSTAQCELTLQALRTASLIVSSKWKLQIMVVLLSGVRHFRGLERSIPGISTKVLAKELKDLEAHQLITRTVVPGPPVVINYQALPYARSLDPVIAILKEWGIEHQQRLSAPDPCSD